MHLFDSYNAAIEGMYKHLLRKSSKNGFTFISEAQVKNIERPILNMEHLTCFMGGLLGLGVHSMSQLENSHEYKERIERDMQTAKAVTYTCYQMYASTKTGLGSEKVLFVEHKANLRGAQVSSDVFDIQSSAKKYILRPEVVESLYIMHKLTRDPIYREWGKSVN
jgi:mannosyl-oligosaccharide alpha-1,2-mannosidase